MRAASAQPRVLIVAALFTLPYRVMRASAATGAAVTVLGNKGTRGLRFSRHCRFVEAAIDFIDADLDAAAAEIDRWIVAENADIVLPGDAHTTELLSALQDRLAAPCFPLPSRTAFDLLNDKWAFTRFATEHGLKCPTTQLFASKTELEAALAAGSVALPAIAKPLSACSSSGVVKLGAADAGRRIASIDYAPILVQDFIAGEDIGASIFARGGQIESHIVHLMRRRTYRVIDEPRVLADLTIVASALALDGVYNFDMRLTPEGEIYYLECNPRFFYKLDLSMMAGLNFAAAGLPWAADSVPASVAPGTCVRLPKALAADLIKPTSLTRRDWAMFRYLWSDPISYARERLHIDGED